MKRMQQIFGVFLSTVLIALTVPAWAGPGLYGSFTLLTEPTPAAGDEFGSGQSNGVVLSTNGQIALVAAPFAAVGSASGAGKAYLYRRSGGVWTLAQEIDDPDNAANDNFGYGLALSRDGRVALIGSAAAVNGQTAAGKAYLYRRTAGGWIQVHEFDDPAANANDFFGYCGVALSGDGTTAAIGAFGTGVNANANAGAAYVFRASRGGWVQAAALLDPDGAAGDFFGYPLALSAHGSRVLIGSQAAVNGQAGAGKAYLYSLANDGWTQVHEFDDPAAGADDFFGDSGVSLSANGATALIGAVGTQVNGHAFAGEVYVFSASNANWTQTAAIPDPDDANFDAFSYPVMLARGGDIALIGSDAPVNGQAGAGKAYLFYRAANGNWIEAHEFDDPQATAGDNFGDSGVALSRHAGRVFISAYGTHVNNLANAGEAYLYRRHPH